MSTELATYQPPDAAITTSMDFMPVFDIGRAVQRRNMLVEFTQNIMVKDVDYGRIPGSVKPCLYKAGAEKLSTFFGLVPAFEITEQVEDWTGAHHNGEPFFYYRYKCRLSRNGRLIGEGEGSCNTWESKYRYRWVSEAVAKLNGYDVSKLVKRGGTISELAFAIDKGETSGAYGKPAEHWELFRNAIAQGTARSIERKMRNGKPSPAWEIDATECRVPNPDVADQVNTCQKMSQKRALVAAVLISVNASEYFTQDIDDLEPIDAPGHRAPVEGDHPREESKPREDATKKPDPQAAPEVPVKVQEMYRAMAKEKESGFANVFNSLREELQFLMGDEPGLEEYIRVLSLQGIGSWQQIKRFGDGKKCVLALYNRIKELSADLDSAPIDLVAEEVHA